jgi:enterochelin esterase-like enzyme
MKFSLLLLPALLCGGHLTAADSVAASTNLPGVEFPRIATDLSVSFRLKAPEAKVVKLEGGAGLVKEPLAMTKGDDGTWSVTTPPAVPGFHYYWFTVDGLRVNDGGSRLFFGWGRDTSGVEVPEAGSDFYDAKPEVPRGVVRIQWYHSKVTGQWRRAHIYTPPGYDKETQTRYPVLYLLHGAGENERSWIEQGRANFIMDNLLAAQKAEPMIVVVDSGYAAYPASDPRSKVRVTAGTTDAFKEVMLTELIPLVDSTYRTKADRGHRAMAGLSMGSAQTLNLTLRNLDHFAWIGGMSGPPREGFDIATAYDGAFKDAAALNEKVRLLWLGAGTAEKQIHERAAAMHAALEKAGIKSVFYSSEGTDHEWQTWRRSLHDFAPRLFKK